MARLGGQGDEGKATSVLHHIGPTRHPVPVDAHRIMSRSGLHCMKRIFGSVKASPVRAQRLSYLFPGGLLECRQGPSLPHAARGYSSKPLQLQQATPAAAIAGGDCDFDVQRLAWQCNGYLKVHMCKMIFAHGMRFNHNPLWRPPPGYLNPL